METTTYKQPTARQYEKSRRLYVIEAAVEYLVSILVTGSFLATMTAELGMSDSLTGVLSSVVSLGCLFQLISMIFQRKRMKPFVVVLSILNQVLFSVMYLIPLWGGNGKGKTAVFITVMMVAYLLYYIAHPKKINWLMSLVEDGARGSFTAKKEIVSLIAGMAFSFGMGALVDHYTLSGQTRAAFVLAALVMFGLTVYHTILMVRTVEKPVETVQNKKILENIKDVLKNRKVLGITVVCVFYYVSTYCATPFYGTYMIHEMGFSLKYISILAMIGSISRIMVSMFWGRYADKKGFAVMVEKCFMVLLLSYVCVMFANPGNGAVMFALYNIFHGIAMGGVNGALTNLVFDYVEPEKRADSLAICQAAAGLAGFAATLAVSPLVAYIQGNGNRLFGVPMYAQQLVSGFSVVFVIIVIVFVRVELKKPEEVRAE